MTQGVEFLRARTLVLALVAGILAAFTFGLAATDASAQGPGSQFCEEYPSFPSCQGEDPDEPGGEGDAPPPTSSGTDGPTADASAGELPFTGYPLTALILLLVVLLLAGLALRSYLAVRDRVTHHDGP